MRKVLVLLFVAILTGPFGFAQKLVTYSVPSERTLSEDFTATVSGQKVDVETIGPGGMENLNVILFSCEGKQSITITAKDKIQDYSIQPKSAAIKGSVKGKSLSFSFDGPKKLYIQINGKPYIALFANPLETNAPKKGTPGVDYYGPGIHNVGRITLHDNQIIYLAGGADVTANINGTAKNVKIFGRGSLNGNLSVTDCENLTVDGIFMRSTRGWTNTVTNSVNTVYNNVKVFSHTGVWGLDGINPVSCKGFVINDCFIRTRDDCIAIKANGNPEKFDLSCKDITITHNLLVGWDHADGVTLGFELNGGTVENILVKDCDILRARGSGRTGGHAAFSIVCDGASVVRNINYEDIRVEADIEYKNLEIILTEAERYGNGKMGTLKGVNLKNITWENARKPFTIVGHPTRFVEDVTFENCYVGGKLITGTDVADFQIEYARNIEFIPGGKVQIDRYPSVENNGRVAGQRRVQGAPQGNR